MSRSNKFAYNIIFSVILQLANLVAAVILPRLMLSVYGSEINGLVTSIHQLIIYLSLVEAGLSASAIYSLYKPISINDHLRINRILVAARNFYYKTGFIFLGLVIFSSLIYPFVIKTELLSNIEVMLLVLIMGGNGILEFFTLAKYRTLITADQKTYVISLATTLQIIISTIFIYLFASLGYSIVIVRLIALFSIFIRSLILYIYSRVKYKFISFDVKPDNSALNKRWDALYLQILGVIQTGAPIIIITFILSLEQVSMYAIYYIVIQGITSILSIFMTSTTASFGDSMIRDSKKKFIHIFEQFELSYFIILTFFYSIALIMYIPFIQIYTSGADMNYKNITFAILMIINGYFYSLKTPYGMLIISAGHFKETKIQVTIQAAIVLVIGIPLTYLVGIYGVVIASSISNIYRLVDFCFYIPREITHNSFRKSIIKMIRSVLIMSLFASPLVYYNYYYVRYLNLYDWITNAIIYSIVMALIIFITNFIFDKELLKSSINKMYSIYKKIVKRV